MSKVAVKFKVKKGSAQVGEVHSYDPADAERLVKQGVAEYVETEVKGPKRSAKD